MAIHKTAKQLRAEVGAADALSAVERAEKRKLDRKIMGGRKVTRKEIDRAFELKRKQDHARTAEPRAEP